MSRSIDNRIVAMKFDNAQFERGVKTTMGSLNDLNKGLQLEGIGKGVDTIASKFSAFHVAAFTLIQELTRGVINLGKKMGQAVMGPIVEGGKKRALAIEQAKFQFKGLEMDVEATMASALEAVKGTAFGLDEAATAAAMFGATGLRAGEEMTNALRGISGVAAMAGSEYSDIANVFTKVAGQGRLMGDDLNRLATRGINAAATLGKAMGKTEAEVRQMVTKGQIDFRMFADAMNDAFGEHATKASETFGGSLSNLRAALARIGARHYTNQYEALRRVFNSLTPVVDGLHAVMAPFIDLLGERMLATADVVSAFLDSLDFTDVEKGMTPAIQGLGNVFKALGAILKPIGTAFKNVFPPKSAKQIETFAKIFEDFTKKLVLSPRAIKVLENVFTGLFSILSIGFKVISFIISAIAMLVNVLLFSTGAAKKLGSGIGDLISDFFGLFTRLNRAIAEGKIFEKILLTLGTAIAYIRDTLVNFVGVIVTFIRNLSSVGERFKPIGEAFRNFIETIKGSNEPVNKTASDFSNMASAADFLILALSRISEYITSASVAMLNGLGPAIRFIKDRLSDLTFDNIYKSLKVLIAGGLFFKFSKFLDDLIGLGKKSIGVFSKFLNNFGTPFNKEIRKMLNGVTGALNGMQNKLNAEALKQIAIAIAILAASMFLISMINPDRLTGAMVAVTLLMTEIVAVLAVMNKVGGVTGFSRAAISLTIISLALVLMATAVKRLGNLEPDVLARGLIAISTLLAAFVTFSKLMTGDKGLIAAGVGMIFISTALMIMSKALQSLGSIDQGELIQGMITIGAIFALIATFNKLVNPANVISVALSMIFLSVGLRIMSAALRSFSDLSIDEIGRGLLAMAGSLALIVVAMHLIPKDIAVKAVGLVIIAGAIYILAQALKQLGSMDWDTLATGLVGLGGALAIIAVFLMLASGPKMLVGAIALGIVSGSLLLLAGALATIGSMSGKTIAKSLGTIAAAFLIIGVAGILLTKALPGLLGLGLALFMIGSAVFLAGIGVSLFATGIALLGAALASGGAAIVAFLVALSMALPLMAEGLARGVGAFAKGLIQQQKVITELLVSMLEGFLDAMISIIPKLIEIARLLLDGFLEIVIGKTPEIVAAFLDMLVGAMEALRDKLPDIVALAAEIAVSFINGLADYYVKIAEAGADFIIKVIEGIGKQMLRIANAAMETVIEFIEGLTTAINRNGARFDRASRDLIDAVYTRMKELLKTTFSFANIGSDIVEGIKEGIINGIGTVGRAVRNLVRNAFSAGKEESESSSPSRLFMELADTWVEGLVLSLKTNADDVATAASGVVKSAYSAMMAASDAALDIFDGLESPTITPVINLDNVNAGAKAISSLIDDASSIKTSSLISPRFDPNTREKPKTSTDAEVSTTETTFNQYNYSPKALSRLEIYRQTRNQLQMLKGLGG